MELHSLYLNKFIIGGDLLGVTTKFMSIAMSLILITITAGYYSFGYSVLSKYVFINNQKQLGQVINIQNEVYDIYDNKRVTGTDIYRAIEQFKDTDTGILVSLSGVDIITGKITFCYNSLVPSFTITNSDGSISAVSYILPFGGKLDTVRFGGSTNTYFNTSFRSSIIKDKNGTIRGIYFKQES